MKNARSLACWLVPLGLLAACGGRSEDHDGSPGTGGSAAATGGGSGTAAGGDSGSAAGGTGGSTKGGTGGTGGSAKGGSSGSHTGGDAGNATGGSDAGMPGVGGGQACCTAAAICPAGYDEIPIEDGCPANTPCQTVTVCCSTILCAASPAQCNAYPGCDQGDILITGGCPPDVACYSRTLCGSTIQCLDVSCNPDADYNDHYVGMGSCAAIDFECPEATTMFFNSCGCGCRQSDMCPQSVDCQPSPEPKPNCTDAFLKLCPYTPRAL